MYRKLFMDIMQYSGADRMPVIHWDGWKETLERWHGEGLPRTQTAASFLGAESTWPVISWPCCLMPEFEEITLEETEDCRTYRDGSGVVCQAHKTLSGIPHYIDHVFKTAKDWEEHIKWRLQPGPGRLPADLDDQIDRITASGSPIVFYTGSLMGYFRNWMGVENLGYLQYDDPEVFADMVMTYADLVCWVADRVLPKVKCDMAMGWEDICGRCGPFVSPDIFRRCVAPGYLKIRQKLETYGIKLYGIDSDGDVSALVGPWLDAGVNVQFPLEVGTWKADGMAFRKKYGKELRIIGHFDKMTLERGRPAVLAELERLKPLMSDGGYVLMTDHLITPGVSLDDYRWYLDQVRALRF